MPMPDLAVPYAAPMPVSISFSVYALLIVSVAVGLGEAVRTSKDHGEGDAGHAQEGRELGREVIRFAGHGVEVAHRG